MYFKFIRCIIKRSNLLNQCQFDKILLYKKIMETKCQCKLIQTSIRPCPLELTNVLVGNRSLKRPFIAIFEVLYLPVLPIT